MTWPARIVRRYICEHFHTHERNWYASDPEHCRFCQTVMPFDRPVVGHLHPDLGD